MGGGLMQLVAYGAQDIYLTGNPQITFFKVVYRRHTNFSMESIEQNWDGDALCGRATSVISRNGDLVHKLYLQQEIYVWTPPDTTSDCECIDGGDYLYNPTHTGINEISIEIGGQRIDRHSGKWMEVISQLKEHNSGGTLGILGTNGGTKFQNMARAGGVLVAGLGKVADKYTKLLDFDALYNFQVEPVHFDAYVPLRFWFCENVGLALPLIALQYHEVKIILELNKNLVVYKIDENCPNIQMQYLCNKLYADYIYLDTDERRRFAQVSHEYLIEQVQHEKFLNTINELTLNFNHPVKEIIWTGGQNDKTGLFGKLPGSSIDYLADDYYKNNNITYELQLNGHQRMSSRPLEYYTKQQVYDYHTGTPVGTADSYYYDNASCCLKYYELDELRVLRTKTEDINAEKFRDQLEEEYKTIIRAVHNNLRFETMMEVIKKDIECTTGDTIDSLMDNTLNPHTRDSCPPDKIISDIEDIIKETGDNKIFPGIDTLKEQVTTALQDDDNYDSETNTIELNCEGNAVTYNVDELTEDLSNLYKSWLLGGRNGLLLTEVSEIKELLKDLIIPDKPSEPNNAVVSSITAIVTALEAIDTTGTQGILSLDGIIKSGKILIDDLLCTSFFGAKVCVPGLQTLDEKLQKIESFVGNTLFNSWEQKVSTPIEQMITLLENSFNELTCSTLSSADAVLDKIIAWENTEEDGLNEIVTTITGYINNTLDPIRERVEGVPIIGTPITGIILGLELILNTVPTTLVELFTDFSRGPVVEIQALLDEYKDDCERYKKTLNELLEVKKLLKELEEKRIAELVKYDIHVDIRKIQEDLSTGVGNEEINGCLKSLKNVDTGEVLYPNGLLDIFCIAWDQLNKEGDNTSIINPSINPTFSTLLDKENPDEAAKLGSYNLLTGGTSDYLESPLSGGHDNTDKAVFSLPVEIFSHCGKLVFNGEIYKIVESIQKLPCRDNVLLQTGMGQASNDAIAVYSFSLRPEEHQPSGTCNFSRIDNSRIVINNVNDKCCFSEYDVYAINYNVLRIMSGMGGLAYSN